MNPEGSHSFLMATWEVWKVTGHMGFGTGLGLEWLKSAALCFYMWVDQSGVILFKINLKVDSVWWLVLCWPMSYTHMWTLLHQHTHKHTPACIHRRINYEPKAQCTLHGKTVVRGGRWEGKRSFTSSAGCMFEKDLTLMVLPLSTQNVPPDLSICTFVLEQSLSVRALQEMLANTMEKSEGVSTHFCRLLLFYWI